MQTLLPQSFGAKADGKTPDTAAVQAALDAARPGDTVRFAGGTFLLGSFHLRSGVSLDVAPDAVLLASRRIEDYVPCDFFHEEMKVTTGLFYALGCDDVTISGGGTIDLSGDAFADFSECCPPFVDKATLTPEWEAQMCVAMPKRPTQPLFFDSCRRVAVRDLLVKNAPCWTFTFSDCEDVAFERVRVENHPRIPNNDGVHFSSCRRVAVRDCVFHCGDDCFAATCITHPRVPCEDLLVERCTMSSRSAAIRFGHLHSTVRRATVRDVKVELSNRAICVFAKDGGLVEDVSFERIEAETKIHAGWWWGKGEPFVLCAAASTGRVERVALRDCSFVCENPGVVAGAGVRGVEISGCSFRHEKGDTHPAFRRKMDLQPNVPELADAPWPDGATLWVDGASAVSVR